MCVICVKLSVTEIQSFHMLLVLNIESIIL